MKSTFVTGIISLVVISGLAILWAAERAKPHAVPQDNSQIPSGSSGYGMKLLPTELSTTSISNTSSRGSAGGGSKTTLPGSALQGGQTTPAGGLPR